MQVSKWIHPTTGQIRLYCNLGLGRGVKVWIEDGGDKYAIAHTPHVVIRADYMVNKRDIGNEVGDWIDANGGRDGFDKLVAEVAHA